jgi:uncharacterized protein YbgA (DUF1722 family)/uncharacterized protein YbbK (DUF523 family)
MGWRKSNGDFLLRRHDRCANYVHSFDNGRAMPYIGAMETNTERPRIAVSACLLGREVRFDGGHTRDRYLTDALAEHVDFLPMCPEMEAGFGSPRPSIRQVRAADGALRVVSQRGETDVTPALAAAVDRRVEGLSADAASNLCGFVLKKDSPSCGPFRIRVHGVDGRLERDGSGLLVHALRARFPHLPIEDEGRLNDAGLRESFLIRVYAWHRWQRMLATGLDRRSLREFHAAHKMLLHAHAPARTRALGRLVARPDAGAAEVGADAREYASALMEILSKPATRGRHVDTLQHLAGHLGEDLPSEERRALHALIDEYRQGWVTLETPMALLRHHLRRIGTIWANAQLYLDPHPRALALRSVIR